MNNYYIKTLREIKSTCMATVDAHNKPQIRVIDIMLAKDTTLFFCTARGKDFHKELLATKNVAILGMTKDQKTIRLNGDVLHLGCDKALLDEIFAENAIMNTVYPGDSRYILDVFCIKDASIEFFDLTTRPITKKYATIGAGKMVEKGFEITESCVSCGECAKVCPQQCVQEKENIYAIAQEHCLHCGLCAETCPTQSIVRL